jgi:phosphoserine phosphatase RsbU/P
MSDRRVSRGLSAQDLAPILAVARNLAAPFDLMTMLAEVVNAAKQVLNADRGTVWLYDSQTDELVLQIATGVEPLRVRADSGIVGSCAKNREIINVPDCYADARFNPDLDRRTDYRTRCMLTLPLVDHKDALVGVLQVLNKADGVFDADDEALASALAAQCAVALQRARMTGALIEGEKMRQQLEMARVVQMSTLPSKMPVVPGYDVFGMFQPADLTGGDTFDLAALEQGLLVVLGDATGHGIAPALYVTQMHAMLRMAFRMGADLETAFSQVNNQLAATLPDDRFITAFIGLLDPVAHRLRFHSGGQAPLLFFKAGTASCVRHNPTSFPLAAMPLTKLRDAVTLEFAPGDILVLLSDGIYEYCNAAGEEFGEARVTEIILQHRGKSAAELSAILLEAVRAFADGSLQEDDITVVLVKRAGIAPSVQRAVRRSIDALPELFDFTSSTFAAWKIDPRLLMAVDFTVEELFTNMVKYSKSGGAAVDLALTPIEGGVEVTLTDHDVDEFDVTLAPDVNVNQPIEQRTPGGLGLHLIRRMVDAIAYRYIEEGRQSRITFRKTLTGKTAAGGAPIARGENADN